MASTTLTTFLVAAVLLTALNVGGTAGVSPAPAPMMMVGDGAPAPATATSDCFSALVNLSDCLTYVEQGSNLTKPDKACCPELAGLVESQPICLCQLLGNTESFGVQIDKSRATALPDVCKVSTPPVSLCSAFGYPVDAPGASPSASPSEGPGGMLGDPTSGRSGNGASSTIALSQQSLLFAAIATAFLTSLF